MIHYTTPARAAQLPGRGSCQLTKRQLTAGGLKNRMEKVRSYAGVLPALIDEDEENIDLDGLHGKGKSLHKRGFPLVLAMSCLEENGE